VRRCGMGEKPQADTSKIRSHEVHNYFKGQVIDFVYNAECVLDDKFENNRGRLPWPVSKGYLLMPYGSNTPGSINVIFENPGLSIGVAIGEPVKVVFNGIVSAVINVEEMQVVIVQHGCYFTAYSNLTGVTVLKGQRVFTVQVIG